MSSASCVAKKIVFMQCRLLHCFYVIYTMKSEGINGRPAGYWQVLPILMSDRYKDYKLYCKSK